MKNNLLKYFSDVAKLSEAELLAIEESMEIKTFPKGSYLLKEGEIALNCFFVLKGCVRQFSVKDGDEITSEFYTENDWIVSMESFSASITATQNWIAVEDTDAVIGSTEKEKALFADFPQFESVARIVVEKMLGDQQQKMHSFLTKSPEERYRSLLENNPDLLQRVSQYHIASYIGVKPESLSRIKKRIIMNDL